MGDLIPRFGINFGVTTFVRGSLAALSGGVTSESNLQSLFGKRELLWTGSGRQAMLLILQALHLKPASKIAIPLFSSSAVANSLRSAGYDPVFVDVDPASLTMCPRSLAQVADRVSAVIAVHLFGNLAAMDRIMDAANGLPVIEDSAQSPLGYWGKTLVGTVGVASFYSFASSKAIPAGGGGMVATSDPGLARSLRTLVSELRLRTRIEGLKSSAQQMAKAALFSRTLYGPLGNRMRSSTEDRGFLLAEVDRKAISASAAAAVVSLAAVFRERTKIQRQNSLTLIDRISDIEGITLPKEPKDTQYGYTLFPVLVANQEERDAIRAGLVKKGIDTSIVHHNSIETGIRHGYRRDGSQGRCPVSEDVCHRLLTLPNYAGLAERDLDRISSSFRAVIVRHRSTARSNYAEAYAS